MKIYNNEFQPIGDVVHWPNPSGLTLVPHPSMIHAQGRSMFTRIESEMDLREGLDKQLWCKLCKQNCTTCLS